VGPALAGKLARRVSRPARAVEPKDKARKPRALSTGARPTVGLKLDPGSKVTIVALVRREERAHRPWDHALHLAQTVHRGE